MLNNTPRIIRGEILHFIDDPLHGGSSAWEHFHDGVMLVEGGRIRTIGPTLELLRNMPSHAQLSDYRGKLILPGFVDTHVHYPQTDIIASPGGQLLEWLEHYTFPAEIRFEDSEHASEVAEFFCDELLRNGTTTAMSFATTHAGATEALFAAAHKRGMRLITGKVLMDRNCPPALSDTPDSALADSQALIERWHRRDRLLYAISPRFAPSCSEAEMQLAGTLFAEHPGLYLQTHLAENRAEVDWVASLHPQARSYLDVYERFSQIGPRAMLAHGIWLDDRDRARLAASGSALSFCPSSNLFLGSGLFDLAAADAHGIRVGIGTDVGAGTSFSLLRTLADAYKVLQLKEQNLTALRAFYLATLGGARSLYLEAQIGNLQTGKEADLVVLDPAATPLIARRMQQARTLEERLFILMTLGDDRNIFATHILGEPACLRATR